MEKNNLYILLICFLLSACSHNYEESVLDEEISDKTPNSIVINFRQVVVEGGKPSYTVEADRAETFNKKKSTIFTDLYFTEYNLSGDVATEGACVEAEYFNNTDDIEFRKKVILNAAEQGYYIESEYLYWNNELKSLSGGGDDNPVTIGRDDGSVIEGYGFSTSSAERSFSFSGKTKGKYASAD